MSRPNDEFQPFGITKFYEQSKKNAEMGRGCVNAILAAPRVVFSLIALAVGVCAAWGTPLVRSNVGVRAVIVQGVLGVPTFALLLDLFSDSPLHPVLIAWFIALCFANAFHFILGVTRVLEPTGSHVHSQDVGRPSPPFQFIWRRLLRSWANHPTRVAILAETPLFFVIAMMFAHVESKARVNGADFLPGAHVIPVLVGMAIPLQTMILAFRDLLRSDQFADQELDQLDVAESMERRPSQHRHRRTEALAVPPSRARRRARR